MVCAELSLSWWKMGAAELVFLSPPPTSLLALAFAFYTLLFAFVFLSF